MTAAAVLELEGVSKHFRQGQREVTAVTGVDLAVAEGEFVSLIGASGCGKSTLLSIVAGLQPASTGRVRVAGHDVVGPGRDRGVVFQDYTLFPWMTAAQNIEFALGRDVTKKQRAEIVQEHLALVQLERFADAFPRQLSGGMRQRVAIARSLCYRPSILLMDEPFGALDAQTRQLMQELLTKIWSDHRLTVLFVTHDIEEAVFLSDRVVLMRAHPGRVEREVTIDLPRPRRYEHLATPDFQRYKLQLLETIRGDALQDFGQTVS